MRKTQFDFLCKAFGNPNLPDNEKWKCVKYIFVENPLVDVQVAIRQNSIMYLDNIDIGPGFYILGRTNSDLGLASYNEKVVTFIPLSMIDKISVTASSIIDDGTGDVEYDEIYMSTENDTLIIHNLEAETYEDIIIINNAVANPDGDALHINKIK